MDGVYVAVNDATIVNQRIAARCPLYTKVAYRSQQAVNQPFHIVNDQLYRRLITHPPHREMTIYLRPILSKLIILFYHLQHVEPLQTSPSPFHLGVENVKKRKVIGFSTCK